MGGTGSNDGHKRSDAQDVNPPADKGKAVSLDSSGEEDEYGPVLPADLLNVDLERGGRREGQEDSGDELEGNPESETQTLLGGGHESSSYGSADNGSYDANKQLTTTVRQSPLAKAQNNDTVEKKETAGWLDLPRKGQLTVITLARLSEPLVQTSLQSYMFYQLKSFNPELSDAVISSQSGIMSASFTATQFLTAMLWGRLADSPSFGRKKVVMIGLAGTMVSCLGFGFAQTFWQALLFRSIGGATNGNVGVMRTMISEIIREKRFQSRAFLILPLTFNIGVIIGPLLGGILSDPAHSYPDLFGDNAFLLKYPYATPNLVSAVVLLTAFLGIWLFLEETLETRRGKRDLGVQLRRKIISWFRGSSSSGSMEYSPLFDSSDKASKSGDAASSPVLETEASGSGSGTPIRGDNQQVHSKHHHHHGRHHTRYTQRLAFRRIFTRNVTLTLLVHSVFGFHMGTFNSLWFVFFSTPVFDPATAPAPGSDAAKKAHYLTQKLPFLFTGGLGLPPQQVGSAMAVLGSFGIFMQMFLYPKMAARLGTVRSWRIFLCCFPLVYFLFPYLGLVPSDSPPPHAKDGVKIWVAISVLLFVHVLGRTFALPAQTILVNNCTPHPSVLGTLHGVAQSVGSFSRTAGPMFGGYLYGLGLEHGIIGAIFWGLSVVGIAGCVLSYLVREGDGHEIWLEGDVEEED